MDDPTVFVARDGEEAPDYLHRRGAHESRSLKNSKVVLLDLKLPEVARRVATNQDQLGSENHTDVMITFARREIC
jgi:hypothetical protein